MQMDSSMDVLGTYEYILVTVVTTHDRRHCCQT